MKKIFWMILIFSAVQNLQAQCENFEMTVTTENPLCYGYSDGDIDVFPSGGTGQLWGQITNAGGFIMLDDGLTGTSPNQLSSGWYYIYVYDESGCELFDTVYLEDPDEMEIILNITLPTALTSCDGIAEIDTVLHHVGAYSSLAFFWSGGPGGLNQTIKPDLCYGEYAITVNNQLGCGVTKNFAVGNVSVNEDEPSKNLLFPNPAHQFTTLKTQQPITAVFVTDYTGKQVMHVQGNASTELMIDVNGLSLGIYQLAIVFEDSVAFTTFMVSIP